MIPELAEIRTPPGKGVEFYAAIIRGRAAFAATRSTAASIALSALSS